MMQIISRHRIYEDFFDDISQEDIRQEVRIEQTTATNTLNVTINRIPKNGLQRSDAKKMKRAMKRFKELVCRTIENIPQLEIPAGTEFVLQPNPKHWNKMPSEQSKMAEFKDETTGLTIFAQPYQFSDEMLPEISAFTLTFDIELKVKGSQFIPLIVSLGKLFRGCSAKCFSESAVGSFGIDPLDKTKPHGMVVLPPRFEDILKHKNDKSTRRYIEMLAKQATGENFREYVNKWCSQSEIPALALSALRRLDMKPEDVIISESDNVVFITIPKGVTLKLDNSEAYQIVNRFEPETRKKLFFTVDGTLVIYTDRIYSDAMLKFIDHDLCKNVNALEIRIQRPQPVITLDDREKNPLNLSLFQLIGDLKITIGKYNGYWNSEHFKIDMNVPYSQPPLVLNPCFRKPLKITIKDANLKKA